MILVDTSVWISFLRMDDDDLYDILKLYLRRNQVIIVSAVVGELLQGAKNKRERSVISRLWESIPKVDEATLFLEAGSISNEHKLYTKGVGLIDCYLLAACNRHELSLWTLDKKLQSAFDEVFT